jgi:hypothetical protein
MAANVSWQNRINQSLVVRLLVFSVGIGGAWLTHQPAAVAQTCNPFGCSKPGAAACNPFGCPNPGAGECTPFGCPPSPAPSAPPPQAPVIYQPQPQPQPQMGGSPQAIAQCVKTLMYEQRLVCTRSYCSSSRQQAGYGGWELQTVRTGISEAGAVQACQNAR